MRWLAAAFPELTPRLAFDQIRAVMLKTRNRAEAVAAAARLQLL